MRPPGRTRPPPRRKSSGCSCTTLVPSRASSSLLRDSTLADDVLQETFLTVSAKAGSFHPGTNFVGWACTIARYKLLEVLRKQAPSPQRLDPEVIAALAEDFPEESKREQVLRHLETCLHELPPSARAVVLLRYFHAVLPDEIGRRLSLKVDSVYVTLTRARKSLRRCVEGRLQLTDQLPP